MKEVKKLSNFFGRFSVGGDKSITIRAILLGALAEGLTVIKSPLICEDTLAAIDCASRLGAQIKRADCKIEIIGAKKIKDGLVLDCKNSATTARLLIGALSGAEVRAQIVGDESLSSRPMNSIIEPLLSRGAKIESNNGFLPVKIYPAKLKEFEYKMPCDSAQVKSGVLFSGLTSRQKTVVIEKNTTRKHTEKMLAAFGADIAVNEKTITLSSSRISGKTVLVPADPSSGAYYAALGLLCGEVTIENLPIERERFGFYDILRLSGARIALENERIEGGVKTADVTARKSNIDYFEIKAEQIPLLVDEIPLISIVAAFNGGCKICGAYALKNKESDRLNGTAKLINAFGGEAEVLSGDLIVRSKKPNKFAEYNSDDHRMIMCAFVLASAACGGVLENENCVNISFPDFFNNLERFRCALFGANVQKSFSAAIHKKVLSAFDICDFSYEQISCNEQEFENFLKKPRYRLINATFPFKKQLFEGARTLTENAKLSQSANFLSDGKGYTTDGDGLLFALKAEEILDDIKNKNVLVLGVGGAGRSIAVSFASDGAKVFLLNRTTQTAENFAQKCQNLKLDVRVYGGESCDIVINACSSGSPEHFNENMLFGANLVIDINYKKPSDMLSAAEKLKIPAIDGEKMLFYQAYLFDCVIAERAPDLIEGKALCDEFFGEYFSLAQFEKPLKGENKRK